MRCYKKMYLHLFNRMTDLIEEMKAAQQETEEIFMSCEEDDDEENNTHEIANEIG